MDSLRSGKLTRRGALKAFTALAGLASLGALAGCAQPAPTPAPAAAPTAKPAAAPTTAPAPAPTQAAKPAAEKKITLNILGNDVFGQDTFDKIYAEYEKRNPNVNIPRVLLPFTDAEPKTLAALAAGDPIDLVYVHPDNQGIFAMKGALTPVDDYLPDLSKTVPPDDWYVAFKYHVWKGKTWALPYQDNPSMLMYNKTLVEKAGLEPPLDLYKKGQWTVKKHDEYVAKLSKGTGPDKVFGTTSPLGGKISVTCMYVWGWGGEVWSKDLTKTLIDSDASAAAHEWMAEQVWSGQAPSPEEVKAMQSTASMFNQGKIAIMGSSRWNIQLMKTPPPLMIVPVPVWPNGSTVTRDATNALGLFSKSKQKEEAWDYLKFMVTRGHEMLVEMGFTTPIRKSLARGEWWAKLLNPQQENQETYDKALSDVRVLESPPRYAEINKVYTTAAQQILLKQAKPKVALAEAKAQMDLVLEEVAK